MVETPATDPVMIEIARLEREHEALERRLAEIDRHVSLTSGEQVERATIKKQKLRLKDRISTLGG